MAMDSYQAFIIQRRAELRRIAARTCGEHTVDDVEVEAWLIAERIGAKRGFPVNFSHREDQEQVLAWLHNEFVKWADKQVRYAVKLDKDWDNEDAEAAGQTLARMLTAPDIHDPAVLLLRREEVPDPLALTRHSYSQASAYVILLCRFEWDAEELASHLRVLVATLIAKVRWAGAWTRWQASLFDGVQSVDLDFEPTKARSCAPRMPVFPFDLEAQLVWSFDTCDSLPDRGRDLP